MKRGGYILFVIHHNHVILLFSDIQECYEVTLQLNATENGIKENGPKDMSEVRVSQKDTGHRKTPEKYSIQTIDTKFKKNPKNRK